MNFKTIISFGSIAQAATVAIPFKGNEAQRGPCAA
jgi:hypothetical protein